MLLKLCRSRSNLSWALIGWLFGLKQEIPCVVLSVYIRASRRISVLHESVCSCPSSPAEPRVLWGGDMILLSSSSSSLCLCVLMIVFHIFSLRSSCRLSWQTDIIFSSHSITSAVTATVKPAPRDENRSRRKVWQLHPSPSIISAQFLCVVFVPRMHFKKLSETNVFL